MRKVSVFLVIVISLFVGLLPVNAQKSIRGKVQSVDTKEKLAYVNVAVLNGDSTFVQGETTNEAGEFLIDNVALDECIVKLSYMGYKTTFIALRNLAKTTNLGSIWLSTTTEALGEVVVQSERLRGIDKQIYFPSKEVLEKSANGLDVTQRLLLPRIIVDTQTNNISYASDKELKLLINGIDATAQEVMMLQPEDIKRIDYYDNPGLRYGDNVGLVMDYIVKKRTSGGFASTSFFETLTSNLGNGQVSGGANWGKSQLKLYYRFNHNKRELFTEATQQYVFPEQTIEREERGKTMWHEIFQMGNIAYNYSNEKDVLNINMNMMSVNQPRNDMENVIKELNRGDYELLDRKDDHSQSLRPSLDIYYSRQLNKKQLLTWNVVGTYNKTQSDYFYKETNSESVLSEVSSHVEGKRFSFIGEMYYENKLKAGTLSAALKHTQGHTQNNYTGSVIRETEMNDGISTGFVQFKTQLSNWGILGTLGGTRASFKQEGNERYTNWSFTPKLSVDYSFLKHYTLRYSYQLRAINPSLSYLSDVEQQKDIYQVVKGNPGLKSYFLHHNELALSINYPFLRSTLSLNSDYYRNPVMEETVYSTERKLFITEYNNQDYYHSLSPQVSIGTSFLKNHVSLNGYVGYNFAVSKGYGYRHDYNQFYYVLQAIADYKKWMFTFTAVKLAEPFWGETIGVTNVYNQYNLSYRFKFGRIGVSSMNLFGEKTKQYSYGLNKNMAYEQLRSSAHLYPDFAISVSLNLNWGSSYKEKQKTLENSDSQDGIL